MANTMTKAGREAFLAALHVGVISISDGERGPLSIPIWYTYEPGGEVQIITGRTSRKARLLHEARRFSLCVQQETLPYKYVSVEGPVVAVEDVDLERDLRPMARRYLGQEGGDAFVEQTGGAEGRAGEILVRMRPERWITEDYSGPSEEDHGERTGPV